MDAWFYGSTTYDGSTGEIKLYRDGQPVSGSHTAPGTDTAYQPYTLYNVGGVTIGCNDWAEDYSTGVYNQYHLAAVEVREKNGYTA